MSRRGGSRALTSVFVRNIHHDCRSEDIRKIFAKYGDISDVYIPLDYYTKEPRGFAYIQFHYLEDAEDAVYYLDGTSLFGRALEVQFAESDRKNHDYEDAEDAVHYLDGTTIFGRAVEIQIAQNDRKTPAQMRYRSGGYRRRSYSRSRSRSRSPRRGRGGSSYRGRRSRSRTRSRSRSPAHFRRSRSGSIRKRTLSRSRSKSRSISPR